MSKLHVSSEKPIFFAMCQVKRWTSKPLHCLTLLVQVLSTSRERESALMRTIVLLGRPGIVLTTGLCVLNTARLISGFVQHGRLWPPKSDRLEPRADLKLQRSQGRVKIGNSRARRRMRLKMPLDRAYQCMSS